MSSDSKKTAMSCLEQLKASGTVVVADTGDFEVGFVALHQFTAQVKFLH